MNIEIANRMVQLRKQHGFSQEELAARLGISRQAVSKWERAESSPDTDNLICLAQLYHISLDELLLGAQEEPVQSRNDKEEKTVSTVEGDARCVQDYNEKVFRFTQQVNEAVQDGPVFSQEEKADPFQEVGPAPAAPQPPEPDTAPEWGPEDNAVHFEEEQAPAGAADAVETKENKKAFYREAAQYFKRQRRDALHGLRGALMGVYPVVVLLVYLVLGYAVHWWHPAWLLFLTIPTFYAGVWGSYPVLVTLVYLLLGFCFGWWHFAWVLYLTIPIFYVVGSHLRS